MTIFRENIDCHYTCLWFFDLHSFQKKNYVSGAEKLKDQEQLAKEISLHSSIDSFFPYFFKKFASQRKVYNDLPKDSHLKEEFRNFIEGIRLRLQQSLFLRDSVSDAQRVRMDTLRLQDFYKEIDRLLQQWDPTKFSVEAAEK